jgi:hypothetical protein
MICSFVCPVDDPPLITHRPVRNKKQVVPAVSK